MAKLPTSRDQAWTVLFLTKYDHYMQLLSFCSVQSSIVSYVFFSHRQTFLKGDEKTQVATGVLFKDVAKVHLLKLNCVDFEDTCGEQMIRFFPTVRLYRRGGVTGAGGKSGRLGGFEEYRGEYNVEALSSWMKGEIVKRHLHTGAKYHNIFSEGCRIFGILAMKSFCHGHHGDGSCLLLRMP